MHPLGTGSPTGGSRDRRKARPLCSRLTRGPLVVGRWSSVAMNVRLFDGQTLGLRPLRRAARARERDTLGNQRVAPACCRQQRRAVQHLDSPRR